MFSDHKKLRNEEKTFIKITKPYLKKKHYIFYSLTKQKNVQNIYGNNAHIREECTKKK